MVGDNRRPYDFPKVPEHPTFWKKYLVDIVILAVVGGLLLVTVIFWVQSTGTQMNEGWHTFHAEPGQLVRIIVDTNEDPVVIYIVEAETLEEWNWDYEDPIDHIGTYEIPPNTRETIELRLPDDDHDANWGFMFYEENGSVSIEFRQTRPIVMDHIFDTFVLPGTLIVLLVVGLGVNNFLRRTASNEYNHK